MEPDNINYRFYLAQEYKNQGLYQQAVEQWEKCLEIDQKHKKTLIALDKIYDELGLSDFNYHNDNKYKTAYMKLSN